MFGHSIYRPTGSHSLDARAATYSRCLRILPTNLSAGVLCDSISSRLVSGPISNTITLPGRSTQLAVSAWASETRQPVSYNEGRRGGGDYQNPV